MTETKEKTGLKLGTHQFRHFEPIDGAFGARERDYPQRSEIPAEFYGGRTPYNKVFSQLFFKGGSLAQFGLKFKADIDPTQAMRAIKALMCSFDPKHEIKDGTVAWALSEWTDGTPKLP